MKTTPRILLTFAFALLASACGTDTDTPDSTTAGTPLDPSNAVPAVLESTWEYELEGASSVNETGVGVAITTQASIKRSTIILDVTPEAVAGEESSGSVRVEMSLSQLTPGFTGQLAHPDPDSGAPTSGPQFISTVDLCTPGIWCTGIVSLPGSELHIDRNDETGSAGRFSLNLECEHPDAESGVYSWVVEGSFESATSIMSAP